VLHFPLGHTCPISGQAAPFHDRIMGTASPQAAFIHFCDVFRLHLALRTTHSPYGFALSGCSVDKIQRLRPYQSVRIEYIIYHSTLQYPPAIFLRKFDPLPNRIHILCVGGPIIRGWDRPHSAFSCILSSCRAFLPGRFYPDFRQNPGHTGASICSVRLLISLPAVPEPPA